MSSTASARKPLSSGVGRVSAAETGPPSPGTSPSRNAAQRSSTPVGHARNRSVRSGTPASARATAGRRDSSDVRAEAASAAEDLQQRLQREERTSERFRTQVDVLQSKLDEALRDAAKWEEKLHENEEQIEALRNEKREATRQIRETESIYESERSAILKEKEELANREEEMQAVIQRLKDSLAQRNITTDDDAKQQRQGHISPALDGSNFAPPSTLQRSDSKNSSKLILQKDKLIESLRLELAEAQIKLVESENKGGGKLQEVERLLMEARVANARLLDDNESYQLLLQERTLKGDFGQSDFSYMSSNANQDALDALEGKGGASSLADELSDATEAESEGFHRLEAEVKSLKEQNKALTLYINKIIERLLQHKGFEAILNQSGESKPGLLDTNKDLPAAPGFEQQLNGAAAFLQRAVSSMVASTKTNPPKARPLSFMPSATNSAHTDPDTAPRIPIGNLGRSASTRRGRPQSEQFTGAGGLVSHLSRGTDGLISPPIGNPRHSQSLFAAPGSDTSNPTSAPRNTSGSQASSGNFPGMRSETSSISGDSGELSTSTPPSQSPPRSQIDKQTTFAGGKPRLLRLVQDNPDAVKEGNKRASWLLQSWNNWAAKRDEGQPEASIPE